MDIPYEDQRAVWTHNDDPAWRERNGTSAMALASGMSDRDARMLCQRLLILMPDRKFEIRDQTETVINTFENRAPVQSSRRRLGVRGE